MDTENEPALPVHVVIVTQHQLLRAGLAALLKSDPRVEVVGSAADEYETLHLLDEHHPNVIVLEWHRPVEATLHLIRRIKERLPEVQILVLSGDLSDESVVDAWLAGATGYLQADASPKTLIASIIAVANGALVMAPELAMRVGRLIQERSSGRQATESGLTRRELQLLTHVGQGQVAKEIARELCISEKTVRNHLSHIYQKLGLVDRYQVALYAIKRGLVAVD